LLELAAPIVAAAAGRALVAADVHVTMCFLGAVDEPLLQPLRDLAARVPASAFTLRFERLELWRESRVLVAATALIPAEGAALATRLHATAAQLGIKPDAKPWRPHLTLGRSLRSARAADTLQWELPTPLEWPVSNIHLAESLRCAAPRRYRTLDCWPLR
jgi:2'-5' RNA ligase